MIRRLIPVAVVAVVAMAAAAPLLAQTRQDKQADASEKAALAAEAADGVVVGSALISLLEPCGTDRELLRSKAVPFLRSLREAVGRTRR